MKLSEKDKGMDNGRFSILKQILNVSTLDSVKVNVMFIWKSVFTWALNYGSKKMTFHDSKW